MNDMQPIAHHAAETTRKTRKRWIHSLVVLTLLAGGAYVVWYVTQPTYQTAPGGRRGPAGAPVPVLTAPVSTRDVPIYLDALGTVQASASVTVRTMIDGPLIEVNFREGQNVQAGDVLARIDPRPYQAALDQARAKKAQDEAQLANARLDLQRYERLARTAYATAQQADTQRATVAQLEAQIRQDQAQIDSAETQLSYTTITAPISGRTGIKQVDVGNIIRAGDTNGLVVINTMNPIDVIFTLPQQQLARVRAAMHDGMPEVQALGAEARVLDTGRLSVLDNQVDPATGTVRLKATFPNTGDTLWPGGFVSVKLLVETRRDALTVPPAAVQRGPRGAYVYVVQPDQTVVRRMIGVGYEDFNVSVIESGLQAGDVVVTDGTSRLSDGTRITTETATPAAADRPAGQNTGQRNGQNGRARGGQP